MNLRNLTDPEIIGHLQSLTRTKPVNVEDLNEIRKLTETRGLSRRDKQLSSSLLAKYRYQYVPHFNPSTRFIA